MLYIYEWDLIPAHLIMGCKEEFDEGKQHVCNFSQLTRDIRYASLTWLLSYLV